jgi:hypothetical protein
MADFSILVGATSPDEIYQRNQAYVNPDAPKNYNTQLPLADELAFRSWLQQNKVPFDPEAKVSDYDMRGFFKALQGGDPAAQSAVNQYDNQLHYPDKWKTPYHESFSNESQWANANAPRWGDGDILSDSSGRVIFRPK